MIAGIILVTGMLILASQYIDHLSAGGWHANSLSTLFSIPADRSFTGWGPVDHVLGFLIYDTEIWIILLCAAALTYWVTDFTTEKLGLLLKGRPRPPAPEPQAQPTA